jgi:hypothetical protein
MLTSETSTTKAVEIKAQFPTLEVAVCGKWVWIAGDTFKFKKQLKDAGLHWSHEKSKWYWKPAGR